MQSSSFLLLLAVIMSAIAPPCDAQLIINEFRFRGPNGPYDEFVEIYNNSGADFTVTGAGSGITLVASDGAVRFIIPNGTVIPNRGHYLGVNSVGYSLASYPGGNGTTATGDATYTVDIPDNAGLALFNSTLPGDFTLANRLDAVGSTSEANTLYKEGPGYPVLAAFSVDAAVVRKHPCLPVSIETDVLPDGTQGSSYTATIAATAQGSGPPADTNSNASNFRVVSTSGALMCSGTSGFECVRLGAPGPENLSSPIQRNASVAVLPADPALSPNSPPNLVRDFTSDPSRNSTYGTWSIRRRITNNTGGQVTRLRLRFDRITTYPATGTAADFRLRSSSTVLIGVTGLGNVTAFGTILEEPPDQPYNGAVGSTLSVSTVTLGTPLANGATIYVNILAGVEKPGEGSLHFQAELLP